MAQTTHKTETPAPVAPHAPEAKLTPGTQVAATPLYFKVLEHMQYSAPVRKGHTPRRYGQQYIAGQIYKSDPFLADQFKRGLGTVEPASATAAGVHAIPDGCLSPEDRGIEPEWTEFEETAAEAPEVEEA